MNEELIKVLQDAEESFLRVLIKEYLDALYAFSANRDMRTSSVAHWKTPQISKLVLLTYFTKRAALREACGMVMCPLARKYEECSKFCQECPALMIENKIDEAANRMVLLGEAENALFEKYSC